MDEEQVKFWRLAVCQHAIEQCEAGVDQQFHGHITGSQAERWIRLFDALGWSPPALADLTEPGHSLWEDIKQRRGVQS